MGNISLDFVGPGARLALAAAKRAETAASGAGSAAAAIVAPLVEDAQAAAGFDLRADALAFAPKLATGERTTVTGDTGTHAAVAGEVALGGAAATVGALIPNNGRYTKQSGGALWRTKDTQEQAAKLQADAAAGSAAGVAGVTSTVTDLKNANQPDFLGMAGANRPVWAVGADASGYSPFWGDTLGRIHMPIAAEDTIAAVGGAAPGFTFGQGFAVVDQTGVGSPVSASPSASSFIAHDIGAYPTRDVMLTSNGSSARLTYGQGDNTGPQITSAGVRWANMTSNVYSIQSVAFVTAPTPVPAGVTGIDQIVGIGQSLGGGTGGGTPDPDGILDASGRLLMFSTGGVFPFGDSTTAPATDEVLGALVPLQSGTQNRTVWPRAANRLRAALGLTRAVLATTFSVGGALYATLAKGTVPYQRSLRGILRAHFLGWAGGVPVKLRALVNIHGEGNRDDPKATYLGYLNSWRSDYETDARAIKLDPTLVLPMFISQMSSWTSYNIVRSQVPLAQLQAALDNPSLFFLVGPKYHLPYSDKQHLTGPGYAQHGEEIGRALVAVANGGAWNGTWTSLYVSSATRSGTTITASTTGCVGNLVIDTSVVSDPGNYGVTYRDNAGNQIAVSNVTVSGTTIQFTIASAVAGVAEFGMRGVSGNGGGPTTGPRTCFHDSSTDTYADGSPMPKWMDHWEVPVA